MLLFFITLFFGISQAQVPFVGSCPELKTMDDFNMTRYMGHWYEAERYFYLYEFGGKCVNSNYTDGSQNSISIINKQISGLTGVSSSVKGEVIKALNGTTTAKMVVKFPYLPVEAPYWVLETDYESYSVVWSCYNLGIFSTRNSWILTREKHPSIDTMQKAYNVLDKNGISRAYFIRTDQINCPDDV